MPRPATHHVLRSAALFQEVASPSGGKRDVEPIRHQLTLYAPQPELVETRYLDSYPEFYRG